MGNVYLATSGEYDDYRIVAAFTRREDAEALEISDGVQEIALHDGPLEVRDWHQWIWYPDRPLGPPPHPGSVPNPYHPQVYRRIYDDQPGRVELSRASSGSGALWVSGWDVERVKAVGHRQYEELTRG